LKPTLRTVKNIKISIILRNFDELILLLTYYWARPAKDYAGITVGLRSPSGTDSWHHRNGYQHAPKQ
jgi:hypothetical protein